MLPEQTSDVATSEMTAASRPKSSRTLPEREPNLAPRDPLPRGYLWLWSGIVVTALLIGLTTVLNFLPLFQRSNTTTPDKHDIPFSEVDDQSWHAVAVQDRGRYKPFESAAQEVLREIVGRSTVQGKDAVAVLLMWMFETDPAKPKQAGSWEQVPFILCQHRELRELIYRLQDDGSLSTGELLPEQEVLGKFISPAELRTFVERLQRLAQTDRDQFKRVIDPVERQVGEVQSRLALYDGIRGRQLSPEHRPNDRFAYIALDQVRGSPWFTVGELRYARSEPQRWETEFIKDRVKNTPQGYMSPQHRQALEEFQEQVRAGTAVASIDALLPALRSRWEKDIKEFVALRREGKTEAALDRLIRILGTVPGVMDPADSTDSRQTQVKLNDLRKLLGSDDKSARMGEQLGDQLGIVLADRDAHLIEELKKQLPAKQQTYEPNDPAFRMLHLTYLELRFPDLYMAASEWQPFPAVDATKAIAAYNAVGAAYRSGDSARFTEATEKFQETIREINERYGHPYPGADGIGDRLHALVTGGSLQTPGADLLSLELLFNRIQPFKWAWILMLGALILLAIALVTGAKVFYVGGLSLYGVSILFQLFGYFVRVTIAGRPPVTNIYETVIWVAFMTGIFALILEAIYRRRVIALAGSLVSTICLILADQMPLALNPKIDPLVPVLRSNFWLFIHVLTIVSSYAGAALAWGLGNVALLLILFAPNMKEAVKTLSKYTYRAMQIAVLLLATGTFLGGWWAAYSWGRFWGWDPKETGALIALLCYVIPLHMRYIGWIKDFGMAVSAIVCFAAILMAWYGLNFVVPAGLHSYGFGSSSGTLWVYWAALINIEWVLIATLLYRKRQYQPQAISENVQNEE